MTNRIQSAGLRPTTSGIITLGEALQFPVPEAKVGLSFGAVKGLGDVVYANIVLFGMDGAVLEQFSTDKQSSYPNNEKSAAIQSVRKEKSETNSEVETVSFYFSKLSEKVHTIALCLKSTAEDAFARVTSVNCRVTNASDVEYGRMGMPTRGTHSAVVLCRFYRDAATQSFKLFPILRKVNELSEYFDSVTQDITSSNQSVDSTLSLYHLQVKLGATRAHREELKGAVTESEQQVDTLQAKIEELKRKMEERTGDAAEAYRQGVREKAEAMRQEGEEEEADQLIEQLEKEIQESESWPQMVEESEAAIAELKEKLPQLKLELEKCDEDEEKQLKELVDARYQFRLKQPAVDISVERTLAILKPDAVEQGHQAAIEAAIAEAGFQIESKKQLQLTSAQAAEFYKEHEQREFYSRLCKFMSRSPVVVMILARNDAIRAWRTLMGPTECDVARTQAPASIRGRFSTDNTQNVVHGSDSVNSARREINFFFPNSSTLPSKADAAQLVETRLGAALTDALTALAKAKPANPVAWLGQYLIEHNPSRPVVAVEEPDEDR